MTQAPDFRLENSELRSENEFEEFASEDLPYYSDWHGSFEKLPWAFTDEALRAAKADVAIVGAPFDEGVSSRPGARFGPRAIRMAPTAWGTADAWSIQLLAAPKLNLAKRVGDHVTIKGKELTPEEAEHQAALHPDQQEANATAGGTGGRSERHLRYLRVQSIALSPGNCR